MLPTRLECQADTVRGDVVGPHQPPLVLGPFCFGKIQYESHESTTAARHWNCMKQP